MSKITSVNLVDISPAMPFDLHQLINYPFRSRISQRLRVVTPIYGDRMTKQCFKDECDINNILRNYAKTGMLTHLNTNQASYMDLSNLDPDYLQTLNTISDASDAFMQLPAALRKKFDNDSLSFLSFVHDPANAEELVNLGLANPIHKSPGVSDAASPAASGTPGTAVGGPASSPPTPAPSAPPKG